MHLAVKESTPVMVPWYSGKIVASYSVTSPGPTVKVGGPVMNDMSLSAYKGWSDE